MILNIDYLCHIFDSIAHSLSLNVIALAGSVVLNASTKLLILWGRTLEHVEIKLVFVRCSTNTSLFLVIGLLNILINLLLSQHLNVVLITNYLGWVDSTCAFFGASICIINNSLPPLHIISWINVLISTGLWSSFNVILNLLGLLFVWVSDLNALTDLLLLTSIQRIHLRMNLWLL